MAASRNRPAPARVAPAGRAEPVAGPGWARWGELAILLLALVVKLTLVWQLHDHPLLQPVGGLDAEWYVALARQVAVGDWRLGDFVYFVSPLYVYVLGLVFALSGGSLLAAAVLQAVLGVVAVWAVMATARAWFGAMAAPIAGLLATGAGVISFHEVLLLQSALDPVLVATLAWALTRAWLSGGARAWAAAGLLAALFALNRPNALLLIVGLGAILMGVAVVRREGRAVVAVAWFLAASAVGFAPFAARNLAVSGELALVSSHGGLNLYIGNHAGADGTYQAPPGITPSIVGQARDARRVAEAASGRALSDGEVSRYYAGLAFDWWREAPGDAAALFARKIRLLLHRTEIALNYSYAYYRSDESTVLRVLPIGAWFLVPLGVAGLFVAPAGGTRRTVYLAWAALLPLYGLSVALFFVSGRYRLPLLVLACITAAGALASIPRAITAGSWRGLAPLVPAALVSVLTWWPLALDDGRMEERTAMAAMLASIGRSDEAIVRAAAVAATHPQPGTVHYRVARAFQAAGELTGAHLELQRALAIDPGQPEIHFTLGQVLAAQGRVREARPHWLRAAAAGVRVEDVVPAIVGDALAEPDRSTAGFVIAELARTAAADARLLDAAGRRLLERRRGDLAEPYYLALDRRFPSTAGVAEGLGLALLLRGSPARARVALERAAALDGSNASVALNLAVACVQVGDRGGALRWVERAIALKPGYEKALSLQSALRK